MVEEMTSFTATATQDGRWWVIQCDQYPGAISQVQQLAKAANIHREAISFVTELPVEDIDVVVKVALPESVTKRLHDGDQMRLRAEEMKQQAQANISSAAIQMRAEGMTLRDIAFVLGVTYQRVYQLTTTGPTPSGVNARRAG